MGSCSTAASRLNWQQRLLVTGAVLLVLSSGQRHLRVTACDVPALWRGCKQSHGVPDVLDGAYNFGWQPYDKLREMCRSRQYVQVLKCLYRDLTSQCSERKDYIFIQTILDYRMYERATDYICEEHNIGIFEQNIGCLKKFHAEAKRCAQLRTVGDTIKSATTEISRVISDPASDPEIRTNKDALLQFIERTIRKQLCSDRKAFMLCVERQFLEDRSLCPYAMIRLVTNYYTLLLPEKCKYAVGSGYQLEPMADQLTPGQRSRDADATRQLSQSSYSDPGNCGGLRQMRPPRLPPSLSRRPAAVDALSCLICLGAIAILLLCMIIMSLSPSYYLCAHYSPVCQHWCRGRVHGASASIFLSPVKQFLRFFFLSFVFFLRPINQSCMQSLRHQHIKYTPTILDIVFTR